MTVPARVLLLLTSKCNNSWAALRTVAGIKRSAAAAMVIISTVINYTSPSRMFKDFTGLSYEETEGGKSTCEERRARVQKPPRP